MIIIEGRQYRLTNKGKIICVVVVLALLAFAIVPLIGNPKAPVTATPSADTQQTVKNNSSAGTSNAEGGQDIKIPDEISIYFEPDSCELNVEYYQPLSEINDYLAAHPEYLVHLAGNYNGYIASEDKDTTPLIQLQGEYFETLAQNRAEIVKAYLVNIGLDEKRISISNNGAEVPQSKSLSKPELTKNRRVDLTIIK